MFVWRTDSAQLERCILELNVCFQTLWAVSFGSNGENRSCPRGLSSNSESWPVQGWINVTNYVSGRELMSYLGFVFTGVCVYLYVHMCVDSLCMEGYKSVFYTCVSNIFSTEPPPSAHCFVYIHVCVLACVHMCLHACSCASIQLQVHVCTCMWAPEDKVSCGSPGEVGFSSQDLSLTWSLPQGSTVSISPVLWFPTCATMPGLFYMSSGA